MVQYFLLWILLNPSCLSKCKASVPHDIHECLQLSNLRDNLSINLPQGRNKMHFQRIPYSACIYSLLNYRANYVGLVGQWDEKGKVRKCYQGNTHVTRPR